MYLVPIFYIIFHFNSNISIVSIWYLAFYCHVNLVTTVIFWMKIIGMANNQNKKLVYCHINRPIAYFIQNFNNNCIFMHNKKG